MNIKKIKLITIRKNHEGIKLLNGNDNRRIKSVKLFQWLVSVVNWDKIGAYRLCKVALAMQYFVYKKKLTNK